jgi:hypothetical protein
VLRHNQDGTASVFDRFFDRSAFQALRVDVHLARVSAADHARQETRGPHRFVAGELLELNLKVLRQQFPHKIDLLRSARLASFVPGTARGGVRPVLPRSPTARATVCGSQLSPASTAAPMAKANNR